MARIAAVELGTDTCALAHTSVRRGEIHVSAVETLDPASFPGLDALTVAVRQCRKTLKLPRRCRVVLWGLPEGASRKDHAVKPLLAPLAGAGFHVERVVSPCNALAALSRVKTSRGEGATCWLAVNRGGVAIVVVRPGKQLYAHSFVWDSTVGASGSQARMLQRYSLVSYLSPEIKRAMAEARRQGTPVDAVVTCGNLPDLRSLTMPLIEELDVEVETLDSLDGLVVAPAAADRLTEAAPAIRLACAGAVARGMRPWDESKRRGAHRTDALLRVAAVLAIVAIGAFAYAWYAPWRGAGRAAPAAAPVTQATPRPITPPPATPPVVAAKPPVTATKPTVASNPPRTEPRPSDPGRRISDPGAPPTLPKPQVPGGSATPAVAPRAGQVDRPPALPPAPISAGPAGGVNTLPTGTDKPEASPAVPGPGPNRAMLALLKDPVPRVTAILVSNERRFATVNEGQIVGIGDVIGKRIVVAIDASAVVLREPSGVQIRVGLGGRILGVEAGR